MHIQLLVLLSPVFLNPYAVLLGSMDDPPASTAPVLFLQLCGAFVCFFKKHLAM